MNALQECGISDVPDVDTNAPEATSPLRDTFSLNDFKEPSQGDGQALVHDRYLGRGGSVLFVGPTGHGKSVFAIQTGILWSIGKPCFGLRPAAPLRVLYVQAENDAGDIYEIRQGIYEGLEILPSQSQTVGVNFRVATINDAVGTDFVNRDLRPLLAAQRPDLLILDPLLAYLGGDITRQDVVSVFVRSGLQRAIAEAKCGLLLVHHPAKPRDKPDTKGSDDAYFGAGSADLANWARAIIVLKPTAQHGVYKLRLAKRGRKAGWTDADGLTPCIERTIAHGKGGLIYWRETEASDELTGRPVETGKAKDNLLAMVPSDSPLPKDVLLSRAQGKEIGLNKARGFIAELVHEGRLFEWSVPRPGKKPMPALARQPQPEKVTR